MRRACWIIPLAFICVLATCRFLSAHDAVPSNLVGVWRAQVLTPWGLATGETVLMPDGSFTKTFSVGEMITLDVGMYTVGDGYIHFYIRDHEPKIYKGVHMHWVTSETVFFQFDGPDHMICEDRITGSRWEAFRVR